MHNPQNSQHSQNLPQPPACAGVPVIAIDGPTASGKGTVAARVAQALGFVYLDSGAIYRALAVAVKQNDWAWEQAHQQAILELANTLPLQFKGQHLYLDGQDVSHTIRGQEMGQLASSLAAIPAIRSALLARQRAFAQAPGLVADGRDMGSVVFPEAQLKVFLTASAEVRAQRRFEQLRASTSTVAYDQVLQDLLERDHRDTTRAVAPLLPCTDAHVLDCSQLGVDEAVAQVLEWWRGVHHSVCVAAHFSQGQA